MRNRLLRRWLEIRENVSCLLKFLYFRVEESKNIRVSHNVSTFEVNSQEGRGREALPRPYHEQKAIYFLAMFFLPGTSSRFSGLAARLLTSFEAAVSCLSAAFSWLSVSVSNCTISV